MFVWITLTGQTEAGVQVPCVSQWPFCLSVRATEGGQAEGGRESGVLFSADAYGSPFTVVTTSKLCGGKKMATGDDYMFWNRSDTVWTHVD